MIETINKCGIVPVVKLTDVEKAEKLAEALRAGGINCAEITFRAPNAEIAIKKILKKYPDMIVGAGTVLDLREAELAVSAGAKFIVSPGLKEQILQYAAEQNVLAVPGCITPTEIQRALDFELEVVKFFPAEQFGGLGTIKALSAPFPQIRFMPTGGISLANLKQYLHEKAVLACGGTFMVKEELICNSQWQKITQLSREAAEVVRTARGL